MSGIKGVERDRHWLIIQVSAVLPWLYKKDSQILEKPEKNYLKTR